MVRCRVHDRPQLRRVVARSNHMTHPNIFLSVTLRFISAFKCIISSYCCPQHYLSHWWHFNSTPCDSIKLHQSIFSSGLKAGMKSQRSHWKRNGSVSREDQPLPSAAASSCTVSHPPNPRWQPSCQSRILYWSVRHSVSRFRRKHDVRSQKP